MPKLITFEYNWADEMDINEVAVWTDEEYAENMKIIKNGKYPVTSWIGSNQELEFSSPSDISFKATNISDTTYLELTQVFGYKFNSIMEDILSDLAESSDDDEE